MIHTTLVRFYSIVFLTGCLLGGSLESTAASFGASSSSGRSASTTSNRPWGGFEYYKPGLKSQQPAMVQNGRYPASGWYPGQQPATSAVAAQTKPVVETELRETQFYEQQNAVLTVRVVSRENLKTLTPVIPRSKNAVLEQVAGPVASSRYAVAGNGQEIVNEYKFRLTPLRAGEISIPPIRFTGTHLDGKTFSITAANPLDLRVEAANPSVTPWLPLKNLHLRAHLSTGQPSRAGEPVTLTLEMKARGALGSQLPSLESQLESSDFRVYRDDVATTDEVSPGGLELRGSRRETYTVIPLKDGWIELPTIQVAWWDVEAQRPMMAGYIGKDADSAGATARDAGTAPEASGLSSLYFWAPLLVFLGLVAGYWLSAWARTRPRLLAAGGRVRDRLTTGTQRGLQQAARLGQQLSPAAWLNRMRMRLALMMPGSVRLWMCSRCLDKEQRPEAWCAEFKARVCQHLDVSPHAPITAVVEKILDTQPHAEPVPLRALARSMDKAVYGSGSLDFAAWKRDLRQQLRPRLIRRRRSARRAAARSLPSLNPHSA